MPTRSELVVGQVADLAAARHFARRRLLEWGVPGLSDTVALLVSETVTNALLHAGTAAHLSICFDGTTVRIEVRDASVELPSVRPYSELAPTGRGLRLVEALALRWGVIPDRRGKTVWCEVTVGPVRPQPWDQSAQQGRVVREGTREGPRPIKRPSGPRATTTVTVLAS